MRLLLLFSSPLCIFVFFISAAFASSSNETDLQALLEFKAKISHDPFQVLSSWNHNHTFHFCQWSGVICGRLHRRVTGLNLSSFKLAGSISPFIGNFTFLKTLNLQNNSFSSQIPVQIAHLRRLEQLFLNNNSISGNIPANLSSCSKLVVVRLGNNKLKGQIPAELGSLSKLQVLSLFENDLSGTIPHSLGNLSLLHILSLAVNGFTGIVPRSFSQLSSLQFLSLRSNRLSGTIPSSIFNLSSITELDFGENHFHGYLPSDLGFSLPKIRHFAISSNEFFGKIPPSFSNATNLEVLLLLKNNLTGDIPSLAKLNNLYSFSVTSNYLGNGNSDDLSFLSSLANATMLEELGINGNNFGGTIPATVGNLSTSLVVLFLDNNQIIGKIPSQIGSLVSLQEFDVWNNKLSGFIPDSIGELQNLVVLALNNNMFSGKIPSSIGNLTNLIQFLAFQNNISGTIPSNLGKCENLLGLDLSQNKLSGSIPIQVLKLSSLSIYLDLSQNKLTGTLSMEVGNLKNLGEFDVSENELSGEIPSSLGGCVSMEILNMNGNNFQGSIPSSLSRLKALQVLDLSKNNLSGEIPEFLSHFRILQNLNLSYNNFEGKVPIRGIFANASATSVEGNRKLCGGIPKFQLPNCNLSRQRRNRLSRKLKQTIIIISVSSGVTLVLSILFLFWFKQRRRNESTASNISDKKVVELSYQNLLKATNGFSSGNLIGMGNFGSVYKGMVDDGETFIAVKVFNLIKAGGFKSFVSECETLRNIRHRNLVKVLTVCSSIDYEGNDFKALVYEFMINGSLDEWLHPIGSSNEEDTAPKKLNIVERLNIAIDVGHALDYLHNHCETPVVHCDLKPSNVLLDQQLTGHVSDFGLAKFLPVEMFHRKNESSSLGVRGTLGYTPPEYGMGNEVSTSGDMYSYGILLLEMFTGKRPTDEMFSEHFNIHNFAKLSLPNKVVDIVDPDLDWETPKRSRNVSLECLISIVEIGVECTKESPSQRKSIADTIRQLVAIKDRLVR